MDWAKEETAITAMSRPIFFSLDKLTRVLRGLHLLREKGVRRLRLKDSGRTNKPYKKLSPDRAAARKNGYRKSCSPRIPPIRGPKIKPMPKHAPSMPKAAALFSLAVMSAI